MFTFAISWLTTSNLPWFMDLTFQVLMQYCFLQHWTLLSPPDIFSVVSTLALPHHSFWSYFSSLPQHHIGHLLTWGTHLLVPYNFAFSYGTGDSWGKKTEVACHSLLQWTMLCRTLHRDLPVLGILTWLIASLSYTRLWSMWSLLLAFCDCGFSSGGCGTVVLGSVVCLLMDENKWLVQASWREEMAVGETWPCSGVTWGHLFS